MARTQDTKRQLVLLHRPPLSYSKVPGISVPGCIANVFTVVHERDRRRLWKLLSRCLTDAHGRMRATVGPALRPALRFVNIVGIVLGGSTVRTPCSLTDVTFVIPIYFESRTSSDGQCTTFGQTELGLWTSSTKDTSENSLIEETSERCPRRASGISGGC
jgi:hypothetical protein